MAKQEGPFFYEVTIPESAVGVPSWVEVPYTAPMRPDRWRDKYTPLFGQHALRLYGPVTIYDKQGNARTMPGEVFVTKKRIGAHLTEPHRKKVTRSSWQGSGRPSTERFTMEKSVEARVREIPADDVPSVQAVARYPLGEGFRGFGKPFGGEHATWHPLLFTDQRRDAEVPPEMLELRRNMEAQLAGEAPKDAA